nr:PTS glucose transporter subunit IIA [uncultured Caproiciproducens sp.]
MFGLFKKNKNTEAVGLEDPNAINSPAAGKIIPLVEVKDPLFAEEMLGKGAAVQPAVGRIVAPGNGVVSTVADTKHAIGLTLSNGAELLIHVGLDTVRLNGRFFTVHVKKGDKVRAGDLLLEFNLEQMKNEGFDVTIPVIVSNTEQYGDIQPVLGDARELDKMLKLSPQRDSRN